MLARRGRQISENQLRQAARPRGAILIENDHGTAPGFALTVDGCTFMALPGVPAEFDPMVQAAVLPRLRGEQQILRRALYCVGMMEADADRCVAPIAAKYPGVRLQFRVMFPEVHVTMHAPQHVAADLDAATAQARAALGAHVYATEAEGMGLPARVVALCTAAKTTVALAESCTGGLLADLITDVPGASQVLLLGIVAYSNEAKHNLVGVQAETLATHGAVSEPTVAEMAAGVQRLAASTYGLSISGIAGPGGGTPDKAVGTVWLGLSGPQGTICRRLQLPFARRGNKQASAYAALDLLRRQLCL